MARGFSGSALNRQDLACISRQISHPEMTTQVKRDLTLVQRRLHPIFLVFLSRKLTCVACVPQGDKTCTSGGQKNSPKKDGSMRNRLNLGKRSLKG